MKKIVQFQHISLDGFVAGPNGEMNWIHVDEEIFDYVGASIKASNTAIYGRVTYEMMEGYWPTAADQPNASKHDIEHARWYKNVNKVVLSRSMKGRDIPNTKIISEDISGQFRQLKEGEGPDMIIFGSPSATHSLMHEGLIDKFWFFVNPVLLGKGIPAFKNIEHLTQLQLTNSKPFSSGVVCLNYSKL